MPVKSLALVYLARGADDAHAEKFRNFVTSYKEFRAGVEHTLFIILKGFVDSKHLAERLEIFSSLQFTPVYTDDLSFDIGAYLAAARQIDADRICFLNTTSEIVSHYWLAKLSNNLDAHNVGLVGGTGSFESLSSMDQRIPPFPNIHIRSNAFMIDRKLVIDILSRYTIRTKRDMYLIESGSTSITRLILRLGHSALIVGRDGRGYYPENWPQSFTFRQGDQANLLVKDNVTRVFEHSSWTKKRDLSTKTWGRYINSGGLDLLPGAEA